jgi:DEAD/DEAH box helicase
MRPLDIKNSMMPASLLSKTLTRMHSEGPCNVEDLETLALIKLFHPDIFALQEKKVVYLLGLFYKINKPDDILSMAYSVWAESIREEHGVKYTPVQASIKNGIDNCKCYSFSAPTSAGKSYLFRNIIIKATNDIVIIVPSRALISEYTLRIREILEGMTEVLILNFVDDINLNRTQRRVFVLTPERASEIFKYKKRFSIGLFLFDEAQLADNDGSRVLNFDSIVRRSERCFPAAKKVFAHPFVENPDAQFTRNQLSDNCQSATYRQHAVGKIYYFHEDQEFSIFSPFIQRGDLKKNRLVVSSDPVLEVLSSGGSVLIYVSKNSIYRRSIETDFHKYIEVCLDVHNVDALEIIDEIKTTIAADLHNSELIRLMRKGIVIHHGSIPLTVRFLIEKFVNMGFAKLCFATSTLAQGVNMPFDVVWVDNMRFEGSEEDKSLALKNLIGRAGRTSSEKGLFDYGLVVTHNAKTLCKMISEVVSISDHSEIDDPPSDQTDDLTDTVEAIKNETFDDTYNLPKTKIERLKSSKTKSAIFSLLDALFVDGKLLTGDFYRYNSSTTKRDKIKENFRMIFESSLNRPLEKGEKAVLGVALQIFLWKIQGKSFREILSIRASYVTNRKERRSIIKAYHSNQISLVDKKRKIAEIKLRWSAVPCTLPNKSLLKTPFNFKDLTLKDFNYDHLVYDTYDYLDKVISFSLTDVYVAAFSIYYGNLNDPRAATMVKYLRYGTDDDREIWLLRYGFSFEDIEVMSSYVVSVNEKEIIFKSNVVDLDGTVTYELVKRYL